MKLPDHLHQWIDYIEGTLPADEAARLDLAIRQDPDLALQIEGLRQLKNDCPDDLSLAQFMAQKKEELKRKWF